MTWRALCWWRPPCLLREVIVNMSDQHDTALRGVLWQSRGAWLVLRDVTILKAQTKPTPLDGEAVIHRDNVSFLQVVR